VTEWHLLIQDDEGSAIAVPLNTDKLSLGRLEDNLVRLTQRNISRQHAVLTKNEDSFSFQDLDSSNGSFLNGQKIEDIVSLNNGDTLQMGDYVLQLYQGDIKKLHESGGNNLDLKTNPGINLAVLSDLSMEMLGQLASDVSSSFPAKQLFSWAGLNETPPDSVIVHGALRTTLPHQEQGERLTQKTQTTFPLPGLEHFDSETRIDKSITTLEHDSLGEVLLETSSDVENQLLLSDDTGPLLSPILPTKTIELQTKYLFDTVQTTETIIDASSSTDTAEAQSTTQILDVTQDSLYRPSAAALEKDPEVTKPTQPAVPKMHALPRVIIINTELAGKVFPILDENITMGRIPQTDFSIRHKSVSRRHARIYQKKDLYFVEDLESVNGIVVNGINESPQELIDDDIIELGRVKLRFCQAGNPFTLSTAEIQQAHADCDDNMSISTVDPSADPNFLHDNNETIIHTDKRNKVFFWPYVYLASSSDLAPQGS
jgi:pSer/pThr/pTyr-binding forkhead associated (FHA) protein